MAQPILISLHELITASICILLVGTGILMGIAQLIFYLCNNYKSTKLLPSILGCFILVYITISYMVILVRSFIQIPPLFWE